MHQIQSKNYNIGYTKTQSIKYGNEGKNEIRQCRRERLFNLFMDGVMKELKASILNGGVKFGMGENTGKVSGVWENALTAEKRERKYMGGKGKKM